MSEARKLLQELVRLYDVAPTLRLSAHYGWKGEWDRAWESARGCLAKPAPRSEVHQSQTATTREPDGRIYETDSVFGVHQSLQDVPFNGRNPDRTIPYWTEQPVDDWAVHLLRELIACHDQPRACSSSEQVEYCSARENSAWKAARDHIAKIDRVASGCGYDGFDCRKCPSPWSCPYGTKFDVVHTPWPKYGA